MTMKKDKYNCGNCGASTKDPDVTMGNCRLNPPLIRRDTQVDTYPTIHLDNVGCMQHTSRNAVSQPKGK